MSSERVAVTVKRGDILDGEDKEVVARKCADGWYVRTPEDAEFWRFAHSDARPRDVRQLINKKWCSRYAVEPDDFTDRS